MSSLLDVAKAMNAATNETLSLNDSKPLTLMDVAKQESQTLQQVALKLDKEERQRIESALDSTAEKAVAERQQHVSQAVRHAAAEVSLEQQQTAQVLRDHVVLEKDKVQDNEDEGYSSFEDDSTPRKEQKPEENNQTGEDDHYDPPPNTTPSESSESKVFLRAVYHADKYQVRDMLHDQVVDANIADQHGWSGLHWAASQNHSEILELLLSNGGVVNAIEQVQLISVSTSHSCA